MKSDAQLKNDVIRALEWEPAVHAANVGVAVKDGVVTLTGHLDWAYQRNAAVRAVEPLSGVVEVRSSIALKAHLIPADIGTPIREALERQARDESGRIEVLISGSSAILRGTVRSRAAREAAEGAARSAPGISSVVNELEVAG
ncbi:BON domain-containing protein [Variovorax paradoxus]|uniref:Periplasmic protein n=1 Tax=Variovorax paradoxus TaxID=34073 RepID=A0A0H2M853_VARPD|nr:BON domain-containing protein [Variovorax paradoxus]KLN53220.1 periplasmic protein [Variovorax paradoxus]